MIGKDIAKQLGLSALPLAQLQPRQQHLLIAVTIILATLVIAHQFIFQPIDRQRSTLEQELTMARQQAELVQSSATITKALDEERHQLRSKTATSTLFQEITTMAASHEVSVNTVTPQPAQTVSRYARLPVRVEAVGSFDSMIKFVHDLEYSPAHLHIDSIELLQAQGLDEKSPAGSSAPKLQVRLTVSILLNES